MTSEQNCYSNKGFSSQSDDRYEYIDSPEETDEEESRHFFEADNETFVDDFDYGDLQQWNSNLLSTAAASVVSEQGTKLSRSCSQYQPKSNNFRQNAFPYRSLNVKIKQIARASPIGAVSVNSFREDQPPELPPKLPPRPPKPANLMSPAKSSPRKPSVILSPVHCRTPFKKTPLSRTLSDNRRSWSVPSRRLDVTTADILAPMIAQAMHKNGSSTSLRRSKSTIALRQSASSQMKRVNSTNYLSSPESPTKNLYESSFLVSRTPRRQHVESLFEVSSTPSKSKVRRQKSSRHRQLFKDTQPEEPSERSLLRQQNSSLVHRNSPKIKVDSSRTNYNHRNTAVIAPLYSSQTISKNFENFECELETPCCNNNHYYSPYRSPTKSSWGQLPTPSLALGSLYFAAFILFTSGFSSCLLCFYLMSTRGRTYYLDFALFSGFISILLGFLGFRFQYWKWYPNRNYSSGYILSCLFSLLLALGLATLLYGPDLEPPLIDIAGGALCGVAILSASITGFGLISSYCCKYPPPDNRVAHAAQGFSV